MSSKQVHAQGSTGDSAAETPAESTTQFVYGSAADTDALLDEIDGLLEGDAEEFVNNFVQKGGQ